MTAVATKQQQQPIRSTIPARLDRLRWSPFHTRLVLGLGASWILDGLGIHGRAPGGRPAPGRALVGVPGRLVLVFPGRKTWTDRKEETWRAIPASATTA